MGGEGEKGIKNNSEVATSGFQVGGEILGERGNGGPGEACICGAGKGVSQRALVVSMWQGRCPRATSCPEMGAQAVRAHSGAAGDGAWS